MIARWRLQEGNKRGRKRAIGIYGNPSSWWNPESIQRFFDRDVKIYRKTTKRCSCDMCSGHDRPLPRDVRRGYGEPIKLEGESS